MRTVALALVVLALAPPALGADAVAVLTEISHGRGEVLVKFAGQADWQRPQPLLALYPGDQVKTDGDARAVVVFTGGGGARTVTAAGGPLTIAAPAAATGADRGRALMGSVASFLLGRRPEPTYRSLSVRSLQRPPVILAPRSTRVLPGPVTFEWGGPAQARYTVRVTGPAGARWEAADLPRAPLTYPASAPALRPGARYTWELTTPGRAAQRAEFEVVPAADAVRVRDALAQLSPSGSGQPPNTVALLRAGLLFSEGLHGDARRELLAAIARDGREPALHVLLAQVYDAMGLAELAAEAHERATALTRAEAPR
ncbi:MAG: hypothetical protein ACREM3_04080 [Candidatus Rokuibacteriota bacterium]